LALETSVKHAQSDYDITVLILLWRTLGSVFDTRNSIPADCIYVPYTTT